MDLIISKNKNIYLQHLRTEHAQALLDLRLRNHDYLQPFEPIRDPSYFTVEIQEKDILSGLGDIGEASSQLFGIFLSVTDELIGRVALTGIARGPFQNANLGYFIAQEQQGKGYMTEAVKLAARYAFNELGLHRIQAGVMPRNTPSQRVIEKVGFRCEGLAKRYLRINGVWEDHQLFAVTSEEWEK
ncbi:GNAT family N-acetyltransferase [Paenibacillus sp. KQZ6P-2]|uniref:GNAT family N-acetyltransferase n=1 Tax=Paenibacillus mangrovi TaxID=2931978 RepID=A0A9X1WNR7_9BACL|nr:GNAT family protein [Paenibacillus mangrovi]MCJ8010948.1 GNAT family N-acetyltransferase [Paenibacillus mangrovi]